MPRTTSAGKLGPADLLCEAIVHLAGEGARLGSRPELQAAAGITARPAPADIPAQVPAWGRGLDHTGEREASQPSQVTAPAASSIG